MVPDWPKSRCRSMATAVSTPCRTSCSVMSAARMKFPVSTVCRALGGGRGYQTSRERLADGVIKAALFRQRPGIGDHAEGVPLQQVVIMESQRLVDPHSRVDWEFSRLQRLAAARMARIQHRQIVELCASRLTAVNSWIKLSSSSIFSSRCAEEQQILLRRKC